MKFYGILIFPMLFCTHLALAQNAANSTAIDSSSVNSNSMGIIAPYNFFKNVSPLMGVKSYSDSGRFYEFQNPGGRDFKSKNEFFLGGQMPSGYGLFAQGVEYVNTYNSNGGQKGGGIRANPGDPSLSFTHPIYSGDHLIVTGLAREYFPITDRSLSKNIFQQAYYLTLLYKMKNRIDFFNQLIPRYFSQTNYSPADSVLYVEDYAALSHRVNSWFRFGGGIHTMLDVHSGAPTGKASEVYPFADFLISNSIYGGPRLYMPLAVQNSVYDGPVAISTNNFQGELYLQATL